MPFTELPTKARRGALRFFDRNQIAENQRELYRLHSSRHLTTGEHNDVRIPGAVALLRWTGAEYARTGTPGLTVTRSSPGVITIGLPASRFAGGPYVVQVTPMTHQPDSTLFANYLAMGSSQIQLRLFGGGAPSDFSVGLAIHAAPVGVVPISGFLSPVPFVAQGSTFEASDWSALVTNAARMEVALGAEHRADGSHNAWEVPRAVGRIGVDGDPREVSAGVHSYEEDVGDLVVQLASGIVRNSGAGAVAIIATPIGSQPGDDFILQVPLTMFTTVGGWLTSFRVRTFQRTTGNTWVAATCGFSFAVHGSVDL